MAGHIVVIGLGAGEQQEGLLACVPDQVQGEFGRVIVCPAAVLEGHRGAAGPVIDQPVRVEPRDGLVLVLLQQMLGEQTAGAARVDESFQVVQERRPLGRRSF